MHAHHARAHHSRAVATTQSISLSPFALGRPARSSLANDRLLSFFTWWRWWRSIVILQHSERSAGALGDETRNHHDSLATTRERAHGIASPHEVCGLDADSVHLEVTGAAGRRCGRACWEQAHRPRPRIHSRGFDESRRRHQNSNALLARGLVLDRRRCSTGSNFTLELGKVIFDLVGTGHALKFNSDAVLRGSRGVIERA